MGHSSFVAHECSQMYRLVGFIFGEGLDLTTMTLATFSGQEAQGSMTGCRELTVRLENEKYSLLHTFC